MGMYTKAAVINAGLGDISIGLEMAGLKVVAAYEADEKAVEVHKTNIDVPVYLCSTEEIDAKTFPEVDLLAARIYYRSFSRAMRAPHSYYDPFIKLCEILLIQKPRVFFLLLNASSLRDEQFKTHLDKIAQIGYQCMWQAIDVAQATGLPVREYTVCMVGTLQSMEEPFQFPSYNTPIQMHPEQYLQLNQFVDPWYYHVRQGDVLQYGNMERFYCWKNRAYVGADQVHWNYMKIPLVNTGEGLRRITHREIANLKSFPERFILPDSKDRQWLYQKLMYAGNILVIKQIAGIIDYILTDNPWRNRQEEREVQFEDLFGRYLANLVEKGEAKQEPVKMKQAVDFVLYHGCETLYFELKSYSGKSASTRKVRVVCERLSHLKADGAPILVLANEIPDRVKTQCLEQFGVYIWDVGNLLWLFGKFADIKNEFIALLDYAIEYIEPKPPVPDVFQNVSEGKKEELSWKEKLQRILPGHEQFREYETACTEILKYVLGDYLTLWKTQESSNDGLYRFDLCCKIKNGANQDFFDTIKHYFNTKYIVFEFKNYRDKISQKEIYTTEKYLYEKALRKVAIIISRLGADEHAVQAARGSLRETGKLILCLSDNALLELIDIKARGEQEPAEFLDALLDDLLVHLEK